MALRLGRRLALGVPLALLLLYGVQPSGAFDWGGSGARSVSAAIATDATAYNAVSGGACGSLSLGGTCPFTITNKGTVAQTYTVTKSSDADSAVSSYYFTLGSSVSSGPLSSAEVAVGNSVTLNANVNGCLCSNRAVYWTIEGSKAGVLNSQELRYPMTLG